MKAKPEVFAEADVSKTIEKLKSFSSNYKNYDEFLIAVMKNLDP